MRIISGSLKGKSISFLKNLNTRPLKDIVKENIFNIIKHSNLINVKIEKSYIEKYFPVHLELKKAMKYDNSKYNIKYCAYKFGS